MVYLGDIWVITATGSSFYWFLKQFVERKAGDAQSKDVNRVPNGVIRWPTYKSD